MYFPVEVTRVPAVTSQTVTANTWANLFSLKCNQNVDKLANFIHACCRDTSRRKWHIDQCPAVGLCSSVYKNGITEQKAGLLCISRQNMHKNHLKGGSSEKDATPRNGRKKNLFSIILAQNWLKKNVKCNSVNRKAIYKCLDRLWIVVSLNRKDRLNQNYN